VQLMIIVHRQPNLLQIVLALSPAGGFPSLLNGGEQLGDQDGDDGNNRQ
jgi:hypothetical protein